MRQYFFCNALLKKIEGAKNFYSKRSLIKSFFLLFFSGFFALCIWRADGAKKKAIWNQLIKCLHFASQKGLILFEQNVLYSIFFYIFFRFFSTILKETWKSLVSFISCVVDRYVGVVFSVRLCFFFVLSLCTSLNCEERDS